MLSATATEIFTSSLPIVGLEIVGGLIAAYGLYSYIKNTNIKSQLKAKDDIIKTNQQTIEAFEDRLNAFDVKIKDLEIKLDESDTKNNTLTSELRDWEQKYKSLETFAAPQLGQQLLEMFSQQEEVLSRIVALLDSIEKRMDAIEGGVPHK